MKYKHQKQNAFLIAALSLILLGCQQQSYQFSQDTLYQPTKDLYQTSIDDRQYSTVHQAILQGDYQRAEYLLNTLPNHIGHQGQQERQLIRARLALVHNQAKSALRLLSGIGSAERLSPRLKQYYYSLSAEAYQRNADILGSIRARNKLAPLLTGAQKEHNQDLIWQSILTLDTTTLQTLKLELKEPDLKAWAKLAYIVKRYEMSSPMYLNALSEWRKTHLSHPGNYYLPHTALEHPEAILSETPKQIALLLPLSGPLAKAGQTVRDGVMSAYYHASMQGQNTNIRVYDSNNQANILSLYQQAMSNGADVIIGPLEKAKVEKLATLKQLSIPVLALNYSNRTSSLYQFGISPEFETRLVADKGRQDGYQQAVIISPEGAWGEHLGREFTKKWRALGGTVSNHFRYKINDKLDQSIRQMLGVEASQQRARTLRRQLANNKIQFTPRRRQDIDMIFLIANPAQGRQIRPLLKFHYAGNVPIYSTSMIYSGISNAKQDNDLDGIIFCDIPWIFNEKNIPETIQKQQGDTRLYALGLDAYQLARQLKHIELYRHTGIPSQSGLLTLQDNQQIKRHLGWAQFKGGQPKLLQAVSGELQ